jgi:hypothetical protein
VLFEQPGSATIRLAPAVGPDQQRHVVRPELELDRLAPRFRIAAASQAAADGPGALAEALVRTPKTFWPEHGQNSTNTGFTADAEELAS